MGCFVAVSAADSIVGPEAQGATNQLASSETRTVVKKFILEKRVGVKSEIYAPSLHGRPLLGIAAPKAQRATKQLTDSESRTVVKEVISERRVVLKRHAWPSSRLSVP